MNRNVLSKAILSSLCLVLFGWGCSVSVPKTGSGPSNDYEPYFCATVQGKDCPVTTSGLTIAAGSSSAYLTLMANNLVNNTATVTGATCVVQDSTDKAVANCTMASYALALPSAGTVTHPFTFDRPLAAGSYTVDLLTADGASGNHIFWPLKVN